MTDAVLLLTAEIVLVVVAVMIYIAGAFVPWRAVWAWIAVGGLVTAALALAMTPANGLAGPVQMDALARYVQWLALGIGALMVLVASRPLDSPGTPEYVGSLVLTIVGVMLVAASGDLVLMFLGLELVSIPTYILLYLGRRDEPTQEAAAKYFYLSILASAMLLYGFSFLYGTAGATDLIAIGEQFAAEQTEPGQIWLGRIALVLVFAGLGFKIAAVPFHFYAPDVYQGTTHAGAALLSVIPKAVGLVALVRIVAVTMQGTDLYVWPVAAVLAAVTMTVGNVLALWQQNLRRLLAYSSIAHAGYMLIGLSVYTAPGLRPSPAWDGLGALLLYLLVYSVATIGTFAGLASLGRGARAVESIDELAGLAWTGGRVRPLLAWSLAISILSLAGIPPLAGFWGKLAVFASALGVEGNPWLVVLAVIGAVNAAVAAAYYLKIVGTMFFRFPLGTPRIREGAAGTVAAAILCAFLVVAIGLGPAVWVRGAARARPRRLADKQELDRWPRQSAAVPEGERLSESAGSEGLMMNFVRH